jgi:hypothetical protein
MAGEEDLQQQLQHHPHPPHRAQVKLAAFWQQTPALWFTQVNLTFSVKHVTVQFVNYCHVVAALPHESICLVADIVESKPSETP